MNTEVLQEKEVKGSGYVGVVSVPQASQNHDDACQDPGRA